MSYFQEVPDPPPGLWVPAQGLVLLTPRPLRVPSDAPPPGCCGLAQLIASGTLSALGSGNEWEEFNSVRIPSSTCEVSSKEMSMNTLTTTNRQF